MSQVVSSNQSMGATGATPTILWSTKTFLKLHIQRIYQRDCHYVWCSPVFEGAAQARYALGHAQPPSSDPASIYRTLHHAVRTRDEGCEKIVAQKKTFQGLAVQWASAGVISDADKEEIFAIIQKAQIADFRPLIYVIPYQPVSQRVDRVAIKDRASLQPEYIVKDLNVNEFEIIEPMPCQQ